MVAIKAAAESDTRKGAESDSREGAEP
jgi:hypothetical protein